MARSLATGDRPLQNGRIAGFRQTFLPDANRSDTARFAVTMFIALCLALLSCLGTPTQALSASQPPNAVTQESQDWAPARLAREGPLEIVIIKPEGSCPEGFKSQLDSHLGAQQNPDFLRVCAETSALLVYPRIWNGSDGTDLVIKSQRSCVPIAILINDVGDGSGDVDFGPRFHSPKLTSPRRSGQNNQQTFLVSARRTHRSIVDLTFAGRFCSVAASGRSPPPSPAEFQEIKAKNSQTRGPPPSSPQMS